MLTAKRRTEEKKVERNKYCERSSTFYLFKSKVLKIMPLLCRILSVRGIVFSLAIKWQRKIQESQVQTVVGNKRNKSTLLVGA